MLEKIHMLFSGLPVVMYHSISEEKNALSIHPDVFEDHCRVMQKAGWTTIGLAEAEAYFLAGRVLPKKAVWLTFDDAYLDNFIYAYPVLQKYGLKGTIFSVLQKIENEQLLRPTIEDVWRGDLAKAELPLVNEPFITNALGFKERKSLFLNWEEIRFLNRSEVFDFAPHSLRHNRVFVSSEYNKFFQPADRTRTFDRVRGDVPWGLPAFKNAAALGNRAFLPNPQLLAVVKNLVPQTKEGAYQFFQNNKNLLELQKIVASFEPENLGRLETDAEMQARFDEEMQECQKIMQKELGGASRTFSWPWGAYNEASLGAAKKVGFQLFVTTKSGANWPGCSAAKFKQACKTEEELPASRSKALRAENTHNPDSQANLDAPINSANTTMPPMLEGVSLLKACSGQVEATVCRFNIKQRNSKELMRRLRILSCNLVAAVYSLLRFRGKL